MDENYLISVIMPVYKVKPFVKESVLSIINQTYKNIELILVDDGDPDKSWEIAEAVLKENRYPYDIIHQENAGLGRARNAGMERAKGDYIYFLDSDDIILNETIERMVSSIQNEEDAVFCEYKSVSGISEVIEEYNNDSPESLSKEQVLDDFLIRRKKLLAPGTLYNRYFLLENNIRFEKIPWSEDQYFLWCILSRCNGVVYLPERLYQYRRNENSIMHSTPVEKIVTSYHEIQKFETYFENRQFGKWVVSRWVMGSIRSSGLYLGYPEWKALYDSLEGKKNFNQLHDFPHQKTRIASYIGGYMPYIFFKINRARRK